MRIRTTITAALAVAAVTLTGCGVGSDWEQDLRAEIRASGSEYLFTAEDCETFEMFGANNTEMAIVLFADFTGLDMSTPITELAEQGLADSDISEWELFINGVPRDLTLGQAMRVIIDEAAAKPCGWERTA